MKKCICLLFLATLVVAEIYREDEHIKIEILEKASEDSCNRKTKKHDLVTMHYSGYLENGTKFDSSMERNEPFQFQLSIGQVIKGWDEGLLDMCPGEKRKLTIKPEMAYGDQGAGDLIPPGSTLIFDVELVHTADGPVPPNVFKEIDTDNDEVLTPDEISAYLVKQGKEHGEVPDIDSQQHKETVLSIFEHEDKDKDGVITHNEFSGPKHDEL